MSTSSTAKPGANGSDNSKVPPPNETNTLAEEERAFRASDEDLVAEQKLFNSNGAHTSVASDANGSGEVGKSHPYRFVPLKMGGGGGTHKATSKSSTLIDEIGGLPALVQMTTFFYANAFQDSVLDTFIRDHDEPHATRFARWVHQKLTDSSVWDEDRASRSQSRHRRARSDGGRARPVVGARRGVELAQAPGARGGEAVQAGRVQGVDAPAPLGDEGGRGGEEPRLRRLLRPVSWPLRRQI